jgi:hypothetical protein
MCRKMLRHGIDGFTSPPKEVVLRILSPLKIHRPRPDLNPRALDIIPAIWKINNRPLVTVARRQPHPIDMNNNKGDEHVRGDPADAGVRPQQATGPFTWKL